ncbi:hypothetical protein HELRODRAFT_178517 [Helobdella robusta]|uniref:Uncharacterized protein n=1 Tax=Helobdella robusta TaxID=6412 RepID=T1FDA6_HELRO|nr:hypothetical protein HELRODRAFT_178517 [Helobdella robusta]ESN97068.1 hypothetical protein HELRODRAFT_178517 [Helobdella robusta]
MDLRGINFTISVVSCSCVPKMNVLYNVTSDLTGDCPPEFDYVVENNKSYNCLPSETIGATPGTYAMLCSSSTLFSLMILMKILTSFHIINAFDLLDSWFGANITNINETSFFNWKPYPDSTKNIVLTQEVTHSRHTEQRDEKPRPARRDPATGMFRKPVELLRSDLVCSCLDMRSYRYVGDFNKRVLKVRTAMKHWKENGRTKTRKN